MADSVAEARRRTRGGQREDESRTDRQTNGKGTEEKTGKKNIETAMTDNSGACQGRVVNRGGKERRGLPAAGFRLRHRRERNIERG